MIGPELPAGSQQTERTARTYAGSRSHHRHSPRRRGWPHRSQRGAGSRTSRAQHRPQTTPGSAPSSGRSHATHARGSSRSTAPRRSGAVRATTCMISPAVEITSGNRLPHRSSVGAYAKPLLECRGSLLDQHGEAIAGPVSTLQRCARPGGSTRPIDEIDDSRLARNQVERHRVLVASQPNRRRIDDERCAAHCVRSRGRGSGRARKARTECIGSRRGTPMDDRNRGVPTLDRREHSGSGSARANHRDRSARGSAKERAD